MDKIRILGVFDFLGFYFCKWLLEEGYEIEGIYFSLDDTELIIENKKLEIGRNANFHERKLLNEKNLSLDLDTPTLIIVDIYELFKENDRKKLESRMNLIINESSISKIKETNSKIIFLLPQILTDMHDNLEIKKVFAVLEEISINFICIYFPNISTHSIDEAFEVQIKELITIVIE